MAKIKIQDLKEDINLSEEEIRKVMGGYYRIANWSGFTRSYYDTRLIRPRSAYRLFLNPVSQTEDEEEDIQT